MATIAIELGKLSSKKTREVYLLVRQGKTRRRVKTGVKLLETEISPKTGKIKSVEKAMAVEKLKYSSVKYDAILMDIQMPGIDGYEAARRIRNLENREVANVPIIAMTANAFDEDKRAALESGMNDHVAKPVDVNVLCATLAKFFK